MHWLANNYLWLLAVVIIPTAGFLLKQYIFKERTSSSPAGTSLTTRDSEVSGSPVVGGSGNVTHISYGQMPASPQPVTPAPTIAAPTPEAKPRSNIQMTGIRIADVIENPAHVVSETKTVNSDSRKAALIRFTNEAKPGGMNAGAFVRASLAYEYGVPYDLRIIGSWLDLETDTAKFLVEESHNLVAGIRLDDTIATIERRRLRGGFDAELHEVPDLKIVHVKLTDASSGEILYQGRFRMTLDPMTIVPDVTGKADVTL